jgi:hypothetical protein
MKSLNGPKAGGAIRAVQQRRDSIQKYYENPKLCLNCGKVIEVGDRKVSDVRTCSYCSHSCAAKASNHARGCSPKVTCTKCGCSLRVKSSKARGTCGNCYKTLLFGRRRKDQVLRTTIGAHARTLYMNSDLPKTCFSCGYGKHIEVCHIRSVSSFPPSALIEEINALDNLKALCPNHHWEYDQDIEHD